MMAVEGVWNWCCRRGSSDRSSCDYGIDGVVDYKGSMLSMALMSSWACVVGDLNVAGICDLRYD